MNVEEFKNWFNEKLPKGSKLRKVVGVILIIIGLLALVTPFTPGSWLAFVGLGLLGIRVSYWEKLKQIFAESRSKETAEWYKQLKRPWWAPPAKLFGPVWSFLYVLIAVSFGFVLYMTIKGQISVLIALPFLLNFIFNLLFTPLQFGLKNNWLAAIDITLVLGTLIWAGIMIYPHAHWIALIQIPYLLWVTFATALQYTVTWLNRKIPQAN